MVRIERQIKPAMAECNAVALRTKDDVMSAYPDLFKGVGKLKNYQYSIKLKEDAKPFCLTTPRRVAIPLIGKLTDENTKLKDLGSIEPVDEPTDWCAPIVVATKKDGGIRLCVDVSKLNDAVKRELYPMPTVENSLGRISKGSLFAKLDANCGFHQIELTPECRKLTTFITPIGRFMYKRLPYGISSAPEIFQKCMGKVLSGIPNVTCHVDDIVISCEPDMYNQTLTAVLDRLKASGVTLNAKKCVFHATKIEYLGQVVSQDGITKAIVDYPAPEDKAQLRRFLGMANQLMKFTSHLAETTQPLRELLSKKNAWMWDSKQKEAFEKVKTDLATDVTLALYDPNRETLLSADSSSYGLGAVLLQKQDDDSFRPVAYASRSMNDTEQRYAQIEKEALAITWAVERWRELLLGMEHFRVETDHKPLVPLLSTKSLDELPLRIQRFRMRLMKYHFKISHTPGKLM